jgi:hypothetical protein
MAFAFRSPTLSGHISEEECIIFDMIRVLGLELPLLAAIEQDFYDSPVIPKEKVADLREEALAALRAFERSYSPRPSAFERAWQAQSPGFQTMASTLRPFDPERCLASLVAVCDDALVQGSAIECLSD